MSTPSAIIVGVGAEQGLGAALCRLLADKGYHVVVAGRTAAKIDQVAATIQAAGSSAEAIETDATDEAAVIRLSSTPLPLGTTSLRPIWSSSTLASIARSASAT
jgi:NADP-dependent 3-hydroxy acid dehydrogenase YdfG